MNAQTKFGLIALLAAFALILTIYALTVSGTASKVLMFIVAVCLLVILVLVYQLGTRLQELSQSPLAKNIERASNLLSNL